MSTPRDLLAAYDAQLRTAAEMIGARRVDRMGPLWLGTFAGRGGFVSYRDLAGVGRRELAELVAGALNHLREDPEVVEVEWKTRSHDNAPGLEEALEAAGFRQGSPEAVMVGECDSLVSGAPQPRGVTLRRAQSRSDVRATAEMLALVFGDEDWERTVEELGSRIEAGDPDLELWGAWAQGRVVGAGRLECVPDTSFAGIWGGGVLPEWRGRGIYRALTAARARTAIARGRRWIHSDSTPMSEPILRRSGLVRVTGTTPWIWHRDTSHKAGAPALRAPRA